jgi:mRNA-degrading endonuclease RelE of RelBE toxin-antitoxin system
MALRRPLALPDPVVETLRRLPPPIKRQLRQALDALALGQCAGKPLQLELQGYRSLRVRRYRVIYREAEDGALQMPAIGPRASIYQDAVNPLPARRR